MERDAHLVLIGMPGVGKSTVGVLLAKATARDFVDTDVWIQTREGRSLSELIEAHGRDGFLALEERHVCALEPPRAVIATGGSVVYSARAMAHLRAHGRIVHLALPLPALERRLADLAVRGVVTQPGQSLGALYEERMPLYRRHADLTLEEPSLNQDQLVARILAALGT
jgi:shikimate kinase